MNLVQKIGITTLSVATLAALSVAPLIALADNNRDRGARDVRELRTLGQRVEIAITDSGNALVRGAKVTGISGSTLTVTTAAGASTLSWAVITDGSTVFVTSTGSGTTLGQISVGDTVSFAGVLSGTGLSVKATAVKDWTLGASERTISGTVQSINSAGTSVVLGNNKATVQFTGATVITLNGTSTSFASIATGDKVKATGVVNAEGTVLTATSVAIIRPKAMITGDLSASIRAWLNGHGLGIFGKKDK